MLDDSTSFKPRRWSRIAVAMFFGTPVFLVMGRRLGHRAMARDGARLVNVGSLEAAVFALLGLMIAFTFSGALTRFDVRRAQAVDEVQRGRARPACASTCLPRVRRSPRCATRSAATSIRASPTYRTLPDLARRADRSSNGRSSPAGRDLDAGGCRRPACPSVRPQSAEFLVMPALNQMFDIAATRVAATQIHPPTIIYLMLIGARAWRPRSLPATETAGEKGYDSGAQGRVRRRSSRPHDLRDPATSSIPRLGCVRIDAIDQLLVNVRAGHEIASAHRGVGIAYSRLRHCWRARAFSKHILTAGYLAIPIGTSREPMSSSNRSLV